MPPANREASQKLYWINFIEHEIREYANAQLTNADHRSLRMVADDVIEYSRLYLLISPKPQANKTISEILDTYDKFDVQPEDTPANHHSNNRERALQAITQAMLDITIYKLL